MSKIALTPNASGTGVFTISSPATNTNRTLTLPDEAGTVLVNGTTSNVGIGTSSPDQKLVVEGNARITGNNALLLGVSGYEASLSYNASGNLYITPRSGYNTVFPAGNVFVGTTNSVFTTTKLQVVSGTTQAVGFQQTGGASLATLVSHNTAASGTIYHLNFADGAGSIRGSITTNGSSTAYNTTSDYRLKEDLQLMSGASERVLALKPVNFAWIESGDRVDGFLAHELAEVVPEAVHGTKDAMRDEQYEVTAAIEATYDEDGNELTAAVPAVMGTRSVPDYQGIDQSKLVPLLTAALQEALTEISALKVRVAALEAV